MFFLEEAQPTPVQTPTKIEPSSPFKPLELNNRHSPPPASPSKPEEKPPASPQTVELNGTTTPDGNKSPSPPSEAKEQAQPTNSDKKVEELYDIPVGKYAYSESLRTRDGK